MGTFMKRLDPPLQLVSCGQRLVATDKDLHRHYKCWPALCGTQQQCVYADTSSYSGFVHETLTEHGIIDVVVCLLR